MSGTDSSAPLLYICMEVLIAVASVIGNVMVIWAVKINKSLRDTTFSFIVSLAVADIAVGALVIPLAITVSIGLQAHFYSCLLGTCTMLVLTQSSILALLAIAIDRYLRVKIPTRYKRVVTSRRAGLAVVICWMVAFIVGLTPMLGWNNLKHLQENGTIGEDLIVTCEFENVISMDYMVYFNFFGCVLPPLLFMLVLYMEIFYMIHKQLNNKKITSSYSDPNKYYDKELNLAKSLVLVLVLFAISWLPLHIINCVTLFCPQCKKPMFLVYVAILLTHGNSAVNPIIYAFRIKKFRTAFHKIWQQYFCCKETLVLDFQQSDRKDMPNLEAQPATPLQPTHLGVFKSYPSPEEQVPPLELQEEQIKTPQQNYKLSSFVEQNAALAKENNQW